MRMYKSLVIKHHSKVGLRLTTAALALTASAATVAGPFCGGNGPMAGPGPYPYSPAGPAYPVVYGHPMQAPGWVAPQAVLGQGYGQAHAAPRYSHPYARAQQYPAGHAMPAMAGAAASQVASTDTAMQADADSDTVTVHIEGMQFLPATLNIKPGTTVTWVHKSNMPHTVSGDAEGLRSSTLYPGQSFSHTFAESGSYDYLCDLHPGMKGRIVVKESGASS